MIRRSRPLHTGVIALGVVVLLGLPSVATAQLPALEDITNTDVELEVLYEDLQDPTGLEVLADGRVIIIERKGHMKIWQQDGVVVPAGRVPVGANACDDCPELLPEEGGLHGLLLAPDFDETGHLYLYYSVPGTLGQAPEPPKHAEAGGTEELEGLFRLSRFTLVDDVLDLDSEVPLLENPAYWSKCCHYGGDLEWLADGTMLLSTGDDTIPHQSSGYAPRDKREGMEFNDADRTSQNPADRRGKILRLNPDGSVPDDNPHVDDPSYDPYVYSMGYRSPYRITVDPNSQSVYVGPYGPGASYPDPNRGPQGYDEFEVIPPGGGVNHGWPHCAADNQPFMDYDFATGQNHGPLSCEGMTPAVVWYPNRPSERWPTLGSGASGLMAGPVYDYEGDGALALPERLHGRLFMLEWHRDMVVTAPVNGDGTLDVSVLWPMFHREVRHPMDAAIGPDGAVYLVEYGRGFYNRTDSRLSRIICAGCEPDPAEYGGNYTAASLSDSVADDATRAAFDGRLLAILIVLGLVGAPVARRRQLM